MSTPKDFDILELADMLARLKAADTGLRVSGSEGHYGHHYRLGPVMSEAELTDFEGKYRIRIPDDYRQFLLNVGNGGAGPSWGLYPLDIRGCDPTKPFPYVTPDDCESVAAINGNGFPIEDYFGVLCILNYGCGDGFLVVNGQSYGTIWLGQDCYYPTGVSFGGLYREWLERSLMRVENERLVPLLRVGMSRAEVVATVGGNWKSRPGIRSTEQFFESREFGAQLTLDEHGIVINVRRLPFL